MTSAVDVLSQTLGAIGTATLEAVKVAADGAQQVEGLQDDPLVAHPPPA
jgi:hypothetical protein